MVRMNLYWGLFMRKLCLLSLSLSVLSAAAVTLDVARLPAPSYADREVSGDAVLPEPREAGADFRVFRVVSSIAGACCIRSSTKMCRSPCRVARHPEDGSGLQTPPIRTTACINPANWLCGQNQQTVFPRYGRTKGNSASSLWLRLLTVRPIIRMANGNRRGANWGLYVMTGSTYRQQDSI